MTVRDVRESRAVADWGQVCMVLSSVGWHLDILFRSLVVTRLLEACVISFLVKYRSLITLGAQRAAFRLGGMFHGKRVLSRQLENKDLK